jgi:hypothetical protein
MSKYTLVKVSSDGHEHSEPIAGQDLSNKEAMKKVREMLEIRSSKMTPAQFKAAGGVRVLNKKGEQLFPQETHRQHTKQFGAMKYFRLGGKPSRFVTACAA